MKTARFSGGRRGAAWILAGAVGVLLQGCVAVIPRAPNVALVEELGIEDAKRKLSEALTRAVEPRVSKVEVTEDHLRYGWDEGVYGVYGVPLGAVPREVLIHFANIEKVDVYENNNVFIHGPGGRVDKVLFSSQADAFVFDDLIQSFRARKSSR